MLTVPRNPSMVELMLSDNDCAPIDVKMERSKKRGRRMRTIVPFVLSLAIAGSAAAQPGVPPIELIEKKIAAGRDTIQDHITLMNLYTGARNIEKRREQILWLIAHNPENPQFRTLTSNIGADSFLPDAEGLAQASELWRAVIARPDVPAAALTNAAWFFRLTDLDFAWSIVKAAEESHRDDLEMKRIRGMLDALTMLHSDTAAAAHARAQVDSSNDARLLIGAADTLTQPPFNPNSRGLTMDDRFDVAEKWLLRAREVAPEDRDGKVALSRIYGMQAGQVADARWKMELYRRANTLAPNAFTLQQLAFAEYEAGEDDAALKTVERMLENKPVTPNVPHIAHTVRGLVALDRKQVDEAKAELLESAKMTMNIEPDRTLAQALIDAGERDVVVQFLEACRTFWKNDRGALDYYI
ncbi:MAG TPA: hypothetical protein VNT29_00045, partial [Candidatus Limnocylindrales bacterium]|nr:hypothetical protein [Candidatus Limnocylindrales bacterium]